MTRKTKTRRINLRPTTEKKFQQVLVTSDDHQKLPSLASRIKAAHPDTEVSKVADVLHYCMESAEMRLSEIEIDQGA